MAVHWVDIHNSRIRSQIKILRFQSQRSGFTATRPTPRPCLFERIRMWGRIRLVLIQTRSTDRTKPRPDEQRQTASKPRNRQEKAGGKDKQCFCTKETVPLNPYSLEKKAGVRVE